MGGYHSSNGGNGGGNRPGPGGPSGGYSSSIGGGPSGGGGAVYRSTGGYTPGFYSSATPVVVTADRYPGHVDVYESNDSCRGCGTWPRRYY